MGTPDIFAPLEVVNETDHVCTCVICSKTWTPSKHGDIDYSSTITTPGPWAYEDKSEAAFDQLVETAAPGLFRVFKQITGHYVHPRYGTAIKAPRIDRILWPLEALIKQGWDIGPIGVECKRSGEKIGPPISQMLDYSRALWQMPTGTVVHCKWVFLWPLGTVGGPIASIMAQNRLGSAINSWSGRLQLSTGGQNFASFVDGKVDLRPIRCGDKVGSR